MASKARANLKKFQKKAGLRPTGKYDSVTRRNLKLARKGKPLQTPAARKKRRADRAKEKLNAPLDTGPLTEQTLRDEIDAQSRLRFGGAERALGDEMRVSQEMRDRRIPSFYDDYLAKVQQIQFAQKAQTDQAVAQVSQMADRDAAPQGASPEAVQAAQSRQALSRSYGGLLTQQGQSQQNNLFEQQRITALRRGQAQQEESNRQANTRAKLLELQREKGDFAAGLRTQARSSERNYQLQQAALGQKQEEAESKAALARKNQKIQADLAKSLIGDRKADNRRMSRKDRLEAGLKKKKFRSDAEKDRYMRKHKLGPYKPASRGRGGSGGGSSGGGSRGDATSRRQQQDRNRNAKTAIRESQSQFRAAGRSWSRYYKRGKKAGQSDAILRAGFEMEKQGYVGPNTNRLLREMGIKLPSNWTRPRGRPASRTRSFGD